jgi:hypothetical protein
MFYISAGVAILGAISYQFFVKRIPGTINPVVSAMGLYLAVLAMSAVILLIIPPKGGLVSHVRQLNWLQIALGGSVLLMEIGFLLMYRYGWNLSTGNLVTGVVVNIGLLALGTLLLSEKISLVNALGIVLSIVGVALISYRN